MHAYALTQNRFLQCSPRAAARACRRRLEPGERERERENEGENSAHSRERGGKSHKQLVASAKLPASSGSPSRLLLCPVLLCVRVYVCAGVAHSRARICLLLHSYPCFLCVLCATFDPSASSLPPPLPSSPASSSSRCGESSALILVHSGTMAERRERDTSFEDFCGTKKALSTTFQVLSDVFFRYLLANGILNLLFRQSIIMFCFNE